MAWNSPIVVGGAVLIYLLITLYIGWSRGKQTENTEESYFVADRSAGWIPTALSMIATIMSGGIYLGTVGLFWNHGVNFFGYGFGYGLAAVLIWVIGIRLWRAGRAFGWTTQHDFYSSYYLSWLFRWPAAALGIIFLIPYFASNGVALGLVLEQFVGIPYLWGVIIMFASTFAYTCFGGMRGVLYTDVFQGIISLAFGTLAFIVLITAAGGYEQIVTTATAQSTFRPASPELYGLFIGWFFFMALHPVSMADRVTRMYSVKNVSHLRMAAIMSGVLLVLMVANFAVLGLATRVLIPETNTPDQVLQTALIQYAPWLVPLMVVVVWATGMSTLDSGLIGADAIFAKDLYRRYFRKDASGDEVVRAGRIFMVLMCVFGTWIAFEKPPLIWNLISVVVTYFIQFVPLTLAALYWRRATKLGAEVGWLAGVIVGTIYQFNLFGLTPFWAIPAGVIGLVPNVVLLVVVSLLTKPLPKEHQDKFYEIWTTPTEDELPTPRPALRPAGAVS